MVQRGLVLLLLRSGKRNVCAHDASACLFLPMFKAVGEGIHTQAIFLGNVSVFRHVRFNCAAYTALIVREQMRCLHSQVGDLRVSHTKK